jgi:hypothetical protein
MGLGLPYHVTQRGNRRQKIFFEDGDYALYRDSRRSAARFVQRLSGATILGVESGSNDRRANPGCASASTIWIVARIAIRTMST